MLNTIERAERSHSVVKQRFAIGSGGFAVLALLLEMAVVILASVATGAAYHVMFYASAGLLETYAIVGVLTAFCYVLPFLMRDEYRAQDFLDGRRSPDRVFVIWNYAFLCLAMIGFLTKTTDFFSRGWLLLFYVAGLGSLLAAEALIRAALRHAIRNGLFASRRVMLVGATDEVGKMSAELAGATSGARVVATAALPIGITWTSDQSISSAVLDEALAAAVAEARSKKVHDIIILTDWSRSDLIGRIVDGFGSLPVAVHLGAAGVLGRFSDARVARIGSASTLSLTEAPLGPGQTLLKRTFDITVAGVALLLLWPVLLAIGLLIRFDSDGPVFFRQRRRGFNLDEFQIWKFRTMSTLDDGDTVVQAQRNDPRVTRVGKFLRRYSLDELPQLLNVLSGEMSIVGPRPHAVAHDRDFEKRIVSYPRRLNVKPGITGWAQVNGHRGLTDTDDAMRARVEHDLYYIDNWSIRLDLYIIAMTVLSPRAYLNAH